MLFSELIKKKLNVKGEFRDIIKISKIKPILLITKGTTRDFNLINNIPTTGVNQKYIEDTNILTEIKEIKSSIVLYDGKATKLNRKARQLKYSDVKDILVIETNDNIYFKEVIIDRNHLLHLLNGPNVLNIWLNSMIEEKVVEHQKTYDIVYNHSSIAHIRHRIATKFAYSFKNNLDNYIMDSYNVFSDVMMNELEEYSKQKNVNKFIYNESLLSFLSDINIRGKKFQKELIHLYNYKRDELLKLLDGTNKDIELLKNNLMEMAMQCIFMSEKDNIFNVIDNKKILFMA
jgi:hypothetical protein